MEITMSLIWSHIMEHPMFAVFLLSLILVWAVHELYCRIYPTPERTWPKGDIGFKAVDPDELYRRCEGNE
jgi:hypothetical protein